MTRRIYLGLEQIRQELLGHPMPANVRVLRLRPTWLLVVGRSDKDRRVSVAISHRHRRLLPEQAVLTLAGLVYQGFYYGISIAHVLIISELSRTTGSTSFVVTTHSI